jgi:molybdopterin synthase catalytic subunit
MTVRVALQAFDPWREIELHQRRQLSAGSYGATAVFIGTMRDMNQGQDVQGMVLEHYPGMTEKYLTELTIKAEQRWELLDVLIVHRVGKLHPDDPIVLVAVWSQHRKAAFEASRYVMEELKSNAPFWKKEQLKNGSRWVEKNTPG